MDGSSGSRHLNSFMFDIGNLRSHHWKHWMDVYENCAYDCKYCVYRSGEKMGKIRPLVDDIATLEEELSSVHNPGIVYLGPKADIYQAQERKLGRTRAVLEAFDRHSIPTFIVTRSELVLRDIDIFRSMASRGLIEISISIASPGVQKTLEPNTPTVAQRLALISALHAEGIPVSVHLSPIIPYLDSVDDIKSLMKSAVRLGAECIYACVLGMAERYYEVVRNALPNDEMRAKIDSVYRSGNRRLDIYSADQDYILELMTDLSAYARQNDIPFACVHIPELDTVERKGHVFDHKLPNVGDMVRYFMEEGSSHITFNDMMVYLTRFSAVDVSFIKTVKAFWNEGILFKNTCFHPVGEDGAQAYELRSSLDLLVTNMRVEPSHPRS